jgi:uncharacterized phiE125 gp8 family phage protein
VAVSLAFAAGTVTATATGHTFETGYTIEIAGAADSGYNGSHTITVTSDDTFTYTPTTAPAAATDSGIAYHLPVSLAEARRFMRIDEGQTITDEDLARLILTATECFESASRRTVLLTKFRTFRDCWQRCYELRRSPFVSTESVKYFDEDGDEQTVSTDDYYNTTDPFYSKLVFLDTFTYPSLRGQLQDIAIEFTAGYSEIPWDIQDAILQHVNTMNENRGDCPNANAMQCTPCQTRTIYNKYKIVEI